MLKHLWNMIDFKVKIGMVAASLLLAAVIINVAPSGINRIEKSLRSAGFTVSQIENIHTRPGKVEINGVSLDPDGFSMMGQVSMTGNMLFPALGQPQRIKIDDLQLTGEWNEEQGLGFAGWNMPRQFTAPNMSKLQRVILSKSIIDLDTPAGPFVWNWKVNPRAIRKTRPCRFSTRA